MLRFGPSLLLAALFSSPVTCQSPSDPDCEILVTDPDTGAVLYCGPETEYVFAGCPETSRGRDVCIADTTCTYVEGGASKNGTCQWVLTERTVLGIKQSECVCRGPALAKIFVSLLAAFGTVVLLSATSFFRLR